MMLGDSGLMVVTTSATEGGATFFWNRPSHNEGESSVFSEQKREMKINSHHSIG